MIVLDTNVVSEAFRANPAEAVVAWFAAQSARDLYVCAPVMAELRYGILNLAAGKKQTDLTARYERVKAEFQSKVLAFNLRAAEVFAELVIARAKSGAPIQSMDAQIAAIARSRNAAVATRDIAGFQGCGVLIIDPWAHGS